MTEMRQKVSIALTKHPPAIAALRLKRNASGSGREATEKAGHQ